MRDEDVLLEYRRVGQIMRVAAVDPATNTEVVIQGPADAGKAALARTALAKLRYVLARKKQAGGR